MREAKLRTIHRLSILTLVLSFAMIVLGGIVKNTGSSLACPDWPLCNGQVFPKMEGSVAIEHSHRLLGATLGLLTACMLLMAARIRKEHPFTFKASLAAFCFVLVQGILGGLTVLGGISPIYSTLHLGLSHLYFATLLTLIFVSCERPPGLAATTPKPPCTLLKLASIACVLVYIQIILGGIIRHFGAGPACGLGWNAAFLCQELTTAKLTLWPANGPGQLHMLHRLNGVLTLFALVGLTIPVLKWARLNQLRGLRRHLIAIHITVTLQVLLGIRVVATYIETFSTTLHLACGLLLWGLVVTLFLRLKAANCVGTACSTKECCT